MCQKFVVDNLTKDKRSKIMASIKGKNTKPELAVRKILWSKGIRYRIHDKSVFGVPDISNKKRKFVIFVDGCFWHGCKKCYVEPKTNSEFWKNKITRNRERRKKVKRELRRDNWKILQFWEHQVTLNSKRISSDIADLL